MPESSVDAVVCDPPYGLEFMGKQWDRLDTRQPDDETFHRSGAGPYDRAKVRHSLLASYGSADARQRREAEMSEESKRRYIASGVTYGRDTSSMQAWHYAWARETFRVLKPGGHLIAFGGPRTFHRLACAVEDAGFEVRDCLSWLYGSGFPKSLDVSKALDKAAGAKREVVRQQTKARSTGTASALPGMASATEYRTWDVTAPATPEAQQWNGWGTALKPAWEPIILARKPLAQSVARNVLTFGTGALNIEASRIGSEERFNPPTNSPNAYGGFEMCDGEGTTVHGRWPANVVLDEDAAAILDEQSGDRPSTLARQGRGGPNPGQVSFDKTDNGMFAPSPPRGESWVYGDEGGASRFFYTAKASASERQERVRQAGERNTHPTVKPLDLMRWLVRLVTPPGGRVLDPFAGSGTTLVAALNEGFDAVGIEREDEYVTIARARIDGVQVGFDW